MTNREAIAEMASIMRRLTYAYCKDDLAQLDTIMQELRIDYALDELIDEVSPAQWDDIYDKAHRGGKL